MFSLSAINSLKWIFVFLITSKKSANRKEWNSSMSNRLFRKNSRVSYIEGEMKIYYLDETWRNEAHTVSKAWHDLNINSRREAFLNGFSTELKAPSRKGCWLIIHISEVKADFWLNVYICWNWDKLEIINYEDIYSEYMKYDLLLLTSNLL